MSDLDHCLDGGYTVGGDRPLPMVPAACYRDPTRGDVFGCNHLRCYVCDAAVRDMDGVWIPEERRDEASQARLLHGSDDWSALEFVAPAEGLRLYACPCSLHIEASWTPAKPADWEWGDEKLSQPWRCAGHPRPGPFP